MKVDEIIEAVCEVGKISRVEIMSPRRASAPWRHLVWWLARERLGLSQKAIARIFNRDHTTIMYGCRRTEHRIAASRSSSLECLRVMQRLDALERSTTVCG